jgi:hypothetical protein
MGKGEGAYFMEKPNGFHWHAVTNCDRHRLLDRPRLAQDIDILPKTLSIGARFSIHIATSVYP